jgi:cell wall-associated NlpC family hydrolase
VAKGDLKRLDTAMPGQPKTGKWMSLPTPGGTLVYRGTKEPEEDDLYASAPVRWDADGKLTELEGLTAKPGDRLGFELRGGLLHVFVQAKDTRSAHVYDTAAKKNLVSVKDIRSALLWPEPSKP